jgi:hypothetical protein
MLFNILLEFEGRATATWRYVGDAEIEMSSYVENYYNQRGPHSCNHHKTPKRVEDELRNGALVAQPRCPRSQGKFISRHSVSVKSLKGEPHGHQSHRSQKTRHRTPRSDRRAREFLAVDMTGANVHDKWMVGATLDPAPIHGARVLWRAWPVLP